MNKHAFGVLFFLSFINTLSAASFAPSVEQGYEAEETPKWGRRETQSFEVQEKFTLTVCNRTKMQISLAFYNKFSNIVVLPEYVVQGFYDAPANTCIEVGQFPHGDFAFWAGSMNGKEWKGKDRQLCIESNRFKRVHFNDHTCDKAHRRGFTNIDIQTDDYTLTLR